MQRTLVEERRWIGQRRFLHSLSYCTLLSGPEAQQLAIYVGWLLNGVRGGLIAGVLFVLPGVVALLALSAPPSPCGRASKNVALRSTWRGLATRGTATSLTGTRTGRPTAGVHVVLMQPGVEQELDPRSRAVRPSCLPRTGQGLRSLQCCSDARACATRPPWAARRQR